MLDPPLRFRIVPAALQVWLPPTAPGLSTPALRPGLTLPVLQRLWSIAAGQQTTSE